MLPQSGYLHPILGQLDSSLSLSAYVTSISYVICCLSTMNFYECNNRVNCNRLLLLKPTCFETSDQGACEFRNYYVFLKTNLLF